MNQYSRLKRRWSFRSSEENKLLFNRFGEALNTRNLDAVRELLTPDFVRHCQATPDVIIKNQEQFIEYLKMDDSTLPDSIQTAELVVAEGDLVAFWFKYDGTQKGKTGPFPPSNKKMQLDVAGVVRVRDGKFAALWITWDNLASLAQLGRFPPKSPKETTPFPLIEPVFSLSEKL